MPRTLRALLLDLVALTLGFGLAAWSTTAVSAARRAGASGILAPTVALVSPNDGQFVSGNVVVSATTGADTDALQFYVGSTSLGPQITSGACTMSWNTTTSADGSYRVTVVASDGSGNTTTSAPATVTVQNTPPQISAIQTTAIAMTSAVITWVTSQPATSGVDYGTSGYSSSTLDANLVATHSAALANLSPGTPYHFRVNSKNAGGVQSTSQDQVFTTASTGAPGVPSPPTGPASGTVQATVSSPFGPMSGATVSLVSNGQTIATTTTDAAGHFQFTGVAPGTYQVWLTLGTFHWLFTTVQVSQLPMS
jgi:hypothetical protein